LKSIDWKGSSLLLLDQRKLPKEKKYIEHKNLEEVISSIQNMVVRGAPAIAISGIFGFVLYLKSLSKKPEYREVLEKLNLLLQSRPTAVNLKIAIQEYLNVFHETYWNQVQLERILQESENFALSLFENDVHTNQKISNYGADLFGKARKINLVTYCNTGAIATAGIGTALGIIRELHSRNFEVHVYACETRPYHQGSRLTTWELMEEGINVQLICDNMVGWLMYTQKIDAVLVGADRITRNGDTANKIGTYSLSLIAKAHNVPFYVAASESSFDLSLPTGKEIQIEMRDPREITQNFFLKDELGEPIYPPGLLAPVGVKVLNPAFDVTPHENITGIITEKGVISPVEEKNILYLFKGK